MSATSSRRLRVGLHADQLFQTIPGGIGRVTTMLLDELPEHADVVAFASGSAEVRRKLEARLDGRVQARVVGIGSQRWQYELWQRYRKRRIDLGVDVCHAPSLAVPPTAAPLVVSINDVAFLRHPHAFTRHGVRFHKKGLEIARREAAAIVVPSAFTCDELVREGFDARRIHHVPLAVRLPPALPSTCSRDQLTARGVSAPYLLVVGTLEPRKDHASVVAAFERVRRRHPELSLVLAGASGWLPTRAAGRPLPPGVIALGWVSDAELDSLYRNAVMVVSASIYEGFGLPVLEGLARGIPVLATGIPAHIELTGHAAMHFAPGDVSMLASEMEELLSDSAARGDLSRAAMQRAKRFSIPATIAGHLSAYESAIAVSSSRESR